MSPRVLEEIVRLDLDVNGLLARGLLRVVAIAARQYEQLLEEHALLDFAGMLARAVALVERQEDFARSRLKLQARYHHVLVDEFQDTSRLQWRLIELLVSAWGEGEGAADAPTSVFIVGDRKQSIYRFRHAEVTLLDEAGRRIAGLRPGRTVRQAITTSFRAVPELLAFVNALATGMQAASELEERFRYGETDRFPVPPAQPGARRDGQPVVGLVALPTMAASAAAVAGEIRRLLDGTTVRDRAGGSRPARPDDIAILFRARAGHQYLEDALEARGIRTYVYKGLGFFDAPEVQDLQALFRYLAGPESDLRAAELLRSRLIRLSDVGLARLAPSFSAALRADGGPIADEVLDDLDRAILQRARESVTAWLALADRVPPGELVDLILRESAYPFEMRGRRHDQARENVKKVRALIRRVESRGYATIGRLAAYFDTLRSGEESNAVVEASGAVSLMTIHAAKGLEFPIVFLVNLQTPGRGRPPGFSIVERGPSGEPEVAFNTTSATRLEEERELEELRRLLYVAATRARDRLYLAAEVDGKGRLRRGARSLASLLPSGLADTFALAAASPELDEVVWTTGNESFAFRVCRPGQATSEEVAPPPVHPSAGPEPPALSPVGRRWCLQPGRRLARPRSVCRSSRAGGDERLLGTLVHRLFQLRLEPGLADDVLLPAVARLVRGDERVDVVDLARLSAAAVRLYRALRQRSDVAALLEAGECFYEVPFSFEPPDRPGDRVRGAIDCVVVAADGSATVLEFKTGAVRPEHDAQARVYAEAIKAALKTPDVEFHVLYA